MSHSRRETIAAWTICVLMIAAAFWFVAAYGLTMPYGDEWEWLPVVVGQQPVSLAWLWSTHNEHRLVLPRLIYLALGELTGFDFRAGPFFDLILLSGLSVAMMLTARRLRGETSIYDIFFPLVLLHWGQCENLIWGFQIQIIASVVLAGIVLIAIVRCGPQLSFCCGKIRLAGLSPFAPRKWRSVYAAFAERKATKGFPQQKQLSLRSAALITTCLVLLGLCGLNGLAYLPALACWLAFAGLCRWHNGEPHARRDGLLMLAMAGVLLALVIGCFIGFRRATDSSPSIWASLATTFQFLSFGIGPAAKEIWPVSGVLVAVACGYAVWQLCSVFRRQPDRRLRTAGLFCFLGGVGCLALAIGVGRAYAGPRAGFMPRYMTLAAPLLCLFYLQFTLNSATSTKIHLQRTLALLMCGLLLVNVHKGLGYARDFQRLTSALEADVRVGLPPASVAIRHCEDLGFAPEDVFAARLEMLRQAKLGPYRHGEGSDASLSAVRLNEIRPSREPAQELCLLPGDSFIQHFQIPADLLLWRIDTQLSRCRGRRTPDRLNWELYSVTANRPKHLLARGAIDMQPVGRCDYVSLAIPRPLAREGQGVRADRLALVLTLPADCPSDSGAELPLYESVGATGKTIETNSLPPAKAELSLKGFAFVRRARRHEPAYQQGGPRSP
jgi:hypothetical protein